MKTTVKLMAMATAMVALASCGTDSVYNPNNIVEQKQATYEKQFVQAFGEISPTNDWGLARAKAKANGTTTRGSFPNSNEWASKYYLNVPTSDDLTQSKIDKIVALFQDPSKATVVESVNWSDFFVQHVYYGKHDNMNQLSVYAEKNDDLTVGREHVYNFNKNAGSTMFMYNSGTANFSYEGEGGKLYNEYIIIYYQGDYYLGFDFECYMNQDTKPDGDYSDWIIRIVPGIYQSSKTTRVMCEDLGTTGDFDFNDVVFDVYQDNNSSPNQTVITVRAAGGTLPLYVGGKEVHEALGVGVSEMVNTGKKSVPVAIYRISKTDIDGIEIKVEGKDAPAYYLKSYTGKAPQVLYVDTDCEWPTENQRIDDRHDGFKNYVGGKSDTTKWW